jgi:hypothetical protein
VLRLTQTAVSSCSAVRSQPNQRRETEWQPSRSSSSSQTGRRPIRRRRSPVAPLKTPRSCPGRARAVPTPVPTSGLENPCFAGCFDSYQAHSLRAELDQGGARCELLRRTEREADRLGQRPKLVQLRWRPPPRVNMNRSKLASPAVGCSEISCSTRRIRARASPASTHRLTILRRRRRRSRGGSARERRRRRAAAAPRRNRRRRWLVAPPASPQRRRGAGRTASRGGAGVR